MIDKQQNIEQKEMEHDIREETRLVTEENELVDSDYIRAHPQKRNLSISLILTVALIAIAFFIAVTYLPGLFRQ
jgi:hypothetical protein